MLDLTVDDRCQAGGQILKRHAVKNCDVRILADF